MTAPANTARDKRARRISPRGLIAGAVATGAAGVLAEL
jgi:hypothetical protein